MKQAKSNKTMYDYRRMTPEQRNEVVEQRRARGSPLHKPPHQNFGEGWYFISAATYGHQHIFNTPPELTALTRRLLDGFQQNAIPAAGWVVMPNHYHILLQVNAVSQVGSVVGPVHGRSSHYANRRDNQHGRKVWYKYSDRKIRSERHFWTCMHYVIMNPVKHGFSQTLESWSWSCYQELRREHGLSWINDLRRDYPLLDFGKDWDD